MLSELIPEEVLPRDVLLKGLCDDSRLVATGDLFCALSGKQHDGKRFVAEAVANGAAAVLCEPPVLNLVPQGQQPVPVIAIDDLRERIGTIASRFYGEPSIGIDVVAVTGTNGKTSFTQMLAQALEEIGDACGVIGTLGFGRPGHLIEPGLTTPSPIGLQSRISALVEDGCSVVVLEASSHGLDQGRLNGTGIDVAVFTNITHDHLDYHESFHAYGAAKKRLFEFESLRSAVVNIDDSFGHGLVPELAAHVRPVTYALNNTAADVYCLNEKYIPTGMALDVVTPSGDLRVELPLFGQFNAQNLLAVAATLIAMGYTVNDLRSGLAAITPVVGRMDVIHSPGLIVIVDYAHTPDALEKCLAAIRDHFGRRKVCCVFGCGGDRDAAKRPMMGEIASRLADRVIVTDDNPRGENSNAIIEDILVGVSAPGEQVRAISDRGDAIRTAIETSASGEVVLVAGKGHEDYQDAGGHRVHFSDYEEINRALAKDKKDKKSSRLRDGKEA